MSIKGHRDQIEGDFWRETFGEKNEEALIAVGGN